MQETAPTWWGDEEVKITDERRSEKEPSTSFQAANKARFQKVAYKLQTVARAFQISLPT